MDPNALPPSYATAMGVSKEQNPCNSSGTPTAPPSHDHETMTTSVTIPILPQPHRPSPAYNPISYPVTRPTPQTNFILRRHEPKSNTKICVCFFITFVVLFVIVVVVVVVAKVSSAKPKFDVEKYFNDEANRINKVNTDWQNKWFKDNEGFLKELQERGNTVNAGRNHNDGT